jgi:hypothetical protein
MHETFQTSGGVAWNFKGEVQSDLEGGACLPTPPLKIRPCVNAFCFFNLYFYRVVQSIVRTIAINWSSANLYLIYNIKIILQILQY